MDKIDKKYIKPECILIRYMKGEDLNNSLSNKEHKTSNDFWDKLDKAMKNCIRE